MKASEANLNDTKETILITGAYGLIGGQLATQLAEQGYHITTLSRSVRQGSWQTYLWDVEKGTIDIEAITTADRIIHLAGSGIAEGRWTSQKKQMIYDSRIDSTKLLFEKVKEHNPGLKQFISASAIGYYGWDSGGSLLSEDAEPGQGFLADVVKDWEEQAHRFEDINVPCAAVRIGLVLSQNGGALVPLKKTVDYWVGAPLATGRQYMSWIHIDDLIAYVIYIMKNNLTGAYNGVAPTPVTNKVFTKQLAQIRKKPLLLPNVPSFMLKLLLGEMSSLLIGGNNVSSKKIEQLGFNFRFKTLDRALEDLL